MEWTDMDELERAQWRDLWLMALGASLVDPEIRKVVCMLPAPRSQMSLTWLHRGLIDKDPVKVWQTMEEWWHVPNCNGRRVIDVILELLPRLPVKARIKRLCQDVVQCREAGDDQGAEWAELELRTLLKRKWEDDEATD